MTQYAYTVIATFADEPTASEYLAWLREEHMADVLRSGALSAHAIRIQDPPVPLQVEVRYTFASRDAYDAYIANAAPTLRARGLERFPPARGITFVRRSGAITSPGESSR